MKIYTAIEIKYNEIIQYNLNNVV